MAGGLTQAGLAHLLGVSRRAVGEWEVGCNYLKRDSPKYAARQLNGSLSATVTMGGSGLRQTVWGETSRRRAG